MEKLNIPYPIIFGTQRPQLRVMLEGGKQYLYSITNYNLFIDESILDEKGNLTINSLLSYGRIPMCTPNFAESQKLVLPCCDFCQKTCPMLFQSYEEMPLEQPYGDGLQLKRVQLHPKPQLYKCKVISPMLNCLTTSAEKKFAEVYYTWAICGWNCDNDKGIEVCNTLSQKYGKLVQSWQKKQLKPEDTLVANPIHLISEIISSFAHLALIPQVWLNYTYDPSRFQNQEMDSIMKDIPKRVDFLFVKKNKIYIVEIDDPSHYATYNDSKKRYDVDEERYTANLRAERILRNQGFEMRRLSNSEVLNSSELELKELILHALGIVLFP
jgi:very-short-patch-repair endonuclease